MGLAPKLVLDTFRIIRDLNKSGVTILLVEQNARLALKLADYGYVLETGTIRMDSDADTLSASNSIVEAYLGA
jgi:branched-chain amino acid transport system ATP-binding protein